MRTFRNILWGFALVAVGVILALNTFDIITFNIFFDGWWTLFIIVPCFIDLFQPKFNIAGIIGLLIGVVLLLSCQGLLDFGMVWKLFFPIILIVVGISCIFKDAIFKHASKSAKKYAQNADYSATFSGTKRVYENESFEGCSLSAVFGGVDLDLRNAIFEGDTVIDATAIFGGINILVSNDVNVKLNTNCMFGGADNKTTGKEGAPTLYINANCLFGGLEVK